MATSMNKSYIIVRGNVMTFSTNIYGLNSEKFSVVKTEIGLNGMFTVGSVIKAWLK